MFHLFISVWENLMSYGVEFRLLVEEESISTDARSRLGKSLVGARMTRVRCNIVERTVAGVESLA